MSFEELYPQMLVRKCLNLLFDREAADGKVVEVLEEVGLGLCHWGNRDQVFHVSTSRLNS